MPGNRVLLHGSNDPQLVACWFGILLAGGVAVATMPMLRAGELDEGDRQGAGLARAGGRAAGRPRSRRRRRAAGAARAARLRRAGRSRGRRRRLRAGRDRGRRRRPDRVHLRHDRRAEGLRALPPRPARVCDTFAAPRPRRPRPDDVFTGTPPLAFTFGLGVLVLFPLRFGRLARAGREARARSRWSRRSQRYGVTDARHRADHVPHAAAQAAPSCCRRCAPASRPASRCRPASRTPGSSAPASASSTASARPRCCTSSSPRARDDVAARLGRHAGARLRGDASSTRTGEPVAAPARSAGSPSAARPAAATSTTRASATTSSTAGTSPATRSASTRTATSGSRRAPTT